MTAVELEAVELRRSLHDGVLQLLEFMASGGWGNLVETGEYRSLADRAACDLRRLVDGTLGDLTLDQLVWQHLVSACEVGGDAQLVLAVDDQCRSMPADCALHLIGAAHELVTNALQHAGASRVVVWCRREGVDVAIDVTDDGCGLSLDTSVGFGLRESVVRRVRDAGGLVAFDVPDEGGTRVRLVAPGVFGRSPSITPVQEMVLRTVAG